MRRRSPISNRSGWAYRAISAAAVTTTTCGTRWPGPPSTRPEEGEPTMAETLKYVGQSMPKVDSLARLTGLAQFTDDIPVLPRTAHSVLVHSPYAHARIRSIDSAKAEAMPGVIAVLDYRRADMKFRWFSGDRAYDRLLFNQELLYHGEIVAMVIAEDRYIAEDAAHLLQVDYEVLPHVIDAQE